ncbi:LPP20 family lipoprotein [Desulfurispirillum indicum]|uniref:LPP20 family lipoprotein n=1 Tax=Desulfurispirillum indicum TaxID=936456 RepID=UPI001CFAF6E8|nr:LPP20 family lipoprotein [Desulfurispirillum indicum]UCZ58001.1 LPP20 family lipoprotein [Desulfurispirillum indicum]
MQSSVEEHCFFAAEVAAPLWYCNPESTGLEGLLATGSAQAVSGNADMARDRAMHSARNDLAMRLEVDVRAMTESWIRQTGFENIVLESVHESVSRQVASQTLRGVQRYRHTTLEDGTVIVLIGISRESLRQSVITTYENEEALHQILQSKEAQQRLDDEIRRITGSAQVQP